MNSDEYRLGYLQLTIIAGIGLTEQLSEHNYYSVMQANSVV